MNQPTTTQIDKTYGTGATIDLKPGTAWAIYSDQGPQGPCGQSMDTTCPHTVLMTWPNEEAMKAEMDSFKPRNKKHTLIWGVVDEYTAGGVFIVVQNS